MSCEWSKIADLEENCNNEANCLVTFAIDDIVYFYNLCEEHAFDYTKACRYIKDEFNELTISIKPLIKVES